MNFQLLLDSFIFEKRFKTCELLKIRKKVKSNSRFNFKFTEMSRSPLRRTERFDFAVCTRLHVSEELWSNEVES